MLHCLTIIKTKNGEKESRVHTQPIIIQPSGPNILIRLLYFIFIGWWLGGIVSLLAWGLNITIIGLPLGLWLLNRLPSVITLRPQENRWRVTESGLQQGQPQRAFFVRALYFLVVGWWLSGVWISMAYAATIFTFGLGLPITFWMLGRIGAITTLYRS